MRSAHTRCARWCRCRGCCRSWPKPMTAGSVMRRASGHRGACVRRTRWRGRGTDRRGQCRWRHWHDLPRVQGRHRHRSRVVQMAGGASRSVRWCRRTMARANCCAWMACGSGARSGRTSCRRIAMRRAMRVPSSWCWRPMRRCCRFSASAWARRALPGSAVSAPTAAATFSWHSRPAIMCARGRRQRAADVVARQHNPAVSGRGGSDGGSHPQRAWRSETMTGFPGHTAHALPLDRVVEVMRQYMQRRPAQTITAGVPLIRPFAARM